MRISIEQIINGKRYDTAKSVLIASNEYWDGHNWERGGRNLHLYKTKKGNFFLVHSTLWQGEKDYIEPISESEARNYFEELRETEVTFEEAFGESPEEA